MKSTPSTRPIRQGRVFLVGAGPGNPELLTLRGWRCLSRADVVIHDRLVNPRLFQWAPAGAEIVNVGKRGGYYSFPQDKINRLLVDRARRGLQVVRLKGGDPFLFGRGAEEALFLLDEKIPFEIVPGVSAGLAAPASAGIPATHRGVSSSVAFVTGQQAPGQDHLVQWGRLAAAVDTLVVLMPLARLGRIVSQLVLSGKPLNTPAALVQNGTGNDQKQVFSSLGRILADSEAAGVASPALLIIGEVVEIGKKLSGLRSRFLSGSDAEDNAAEESTGSL